MSGAASKAVGPCECHCAISSAKTSLVVCLLLVANIGAHLLQRKPDCRDGIAASPEVLTGEVALPTAQLAGDGDRTFPFEETDDRRHRIRGRNLDTYMHVIWHHGAFQDTAFLLAGQRVKDRSQGFTNMAKQGFPVSLRDEDNVVLAIPTRMRQALRGV
jgi:hypothetical protein